MPNELSSSRLIIPFANQNNDLLLLRRRSDLKYYKDLWEFPGGTIEPGETNEQSARREALEETGLSIDMAKLALLACDHDKCRDDPDMPYRVYSYYHQPIDNQPDEVIINPNEHVDYQLASAELAFALETTADTKRAIAHYQRNIARLAIDGFTIQ